MAAIRVQVQDVAASLPFYRALGFRLVDRMGSQFAVMRRDGTVLWLCGAGATPLADKSMRLVVEVPVLDGAIARIGEAGGTLQGPLASGRGGREALVHDANGNPVELFEPHRAADP